MASTIEKSRRNQNIGEDGASSSKSAPPKNNAQAPRQKSRAGNFTSGEMSCRTFGRSIGC